MSAGASNSVHQLTQTKVRETSTNPPFINWMELQRFGGCRITQGINTPFIFLS